MRERLLSNLKGWYVTGKPSASANVWSWSRLPAVLASKPGPAVVSISLAVAVSDEPEVAVLSHGAAAE